MLFVPKIYFFTMAIIQALATVALYRTGSRLGAAITFTYGIGNFLWAYMESN